MKNHLLLIPFLVISTLSLSQVVSTSEITSDYQNRILQNGGSISGNDLLAIKIFVDSSKSHVYWDKLIDVGLLTGDNVNASLVKLKYPAGGESKIVNNGFLPADYISNQGLQLNPSKSLNTKTNLNTLSLQGLFGFSFLISNPGSAWMGSANSATPYSILLGNNNSAIAYIGYPPNYVTVSGGITSSPDAFYHFIKQSLDSAKVFVDGNQVGGTSTILTSTGLRNADVEVFKEASSTGKGLFYCIDNGKLTNSEVVQFYKDVRQLMYGLGRKIAPPVISSNGQYTTSQLVTIKEAPTNSSASGATIYYTTDGSTPTTASAVYIAPLTIPSTTRIQAIAVKNDKQSLAADAWVAIVPEGFNTNKYYTAHVMVNLLAFTNNMDEWLNQMKAAGYNLIWAHLDDYTGNYITTLKSLLDAAQRVGGIAIMPGVSWWVDPNSVNRMFRDTWNQPALFRIGNKRVYTGWDYQPGNQHTIDSLLGLQNITKDQYYLWVHSRYPYSYDEGSTWVGEYTDNNGHLIWNGSSSADQAIDLDHLYKTRPQLDGLIDFAVDQGGDNKNIIKTNKLITQSSVQKGKFSMAGVSSFYASVSYSDFGFKGAAEIWDSLLALPPLERPTAMSDITANDYAELSYISPMVVPATQGLSYIPSLGSGYTLGNNIRYPLTDHSGIQKFLRPWVDAFKNNQPSPTFSEDRIFAWYWLHPIDQQPNPNLPSTFNGYAYLNQDWWNSTLYATGDINVGGYNQVEGMKYFFNDQMNKISMAVHLTAPAQLKINDSLSELKPAGVAYFEIKMGTFRGTPTFSIIRNGTEIKKGNGLQPITNNAFPGGWNFLSTEIISNSTTSTYYRSKISGKWNRPTTWQSSNDSLTWINATSIPSNVSNSITIQNGHIITITDSATVDQLFIQNGAILNVAPNASLIINDGVGDDIVIAATGKMVVQSDSTGAGRIGNSSGSVNGNVTVERYINSSTSKSYRMLSSSVNTVNGPKPFIRDNWQEGQNNTSIKTNSNLVPHYGIQITGSTTGASGFDITTKGTVSLFTYNHITDTPSWIEATNTNATNLDAKNGYLVLISGDRSNDLRSNNPPTSTTIRATGTILTGTQVFTKPDGDRGTFLVTNPYASPINWNTIYNDASTNNAKNFENYYTYWDTRVGTGGGYVTVNSSGIKSAATNATIEIQSGQAFLIKVKKGIVKPTFTVKENHKSTTNNLSVFRVTTPQQLMSSLYFNTSEGSRIMADAVNTVYNNMFSNVVDDNDAEETANNEENIAVNRAGKMLSIEERSEISVSDTLPLAIQRLKIKRYEWQFDPTGFSNQGLKAYLEDQYMQTYFPISLTTVTVIPFTVTSDPGSSDQSRFRVLFSAKSKLPLFINSIIANPKSSGIQVDWSAENEVDIDSYEIETSIDGITFRKTVNVPAKSSSSFKNSYTWFDASPKTGINYYRIKTTDHSGNIKYSKIVDAEFNRQAGNFEVYPNPVTAGYTTVHINASKGVYVIKLMDSNGGLIYEKIIHHIGGRLNQDIPFRANLTTGNYNLQITGNGINFNKQLLKK